MLLLAAAFAQAQAVDPLRLPIGRHGTAVVRESKIVDLRTVREAKLSDIVEAAKGCRFVYLGESHDNPGHHRFQAAVIEALAESGRDVIVGFEMFTRPVQDSLDPWTLGWWTREQFIERSDWKRQWGFPFELYEPIFDVVRRKRLPMVAMNVPRDWVRAVGRGGPEALTPEQKSQVPELFLGNAEHKMVFEALMGGHPMTGAQGANVYAAQVLWDEGMADTALKYLESHPTTSRTVFVVVAGVGHVMYGQGINYRIRRRSGYSGITVSMVEADLSAEVSRGIGDFAYAAKPPPRNPR